MVFSRENIHSALKPVLVVKKELVKWDMEEEKFVHAGIGYLRNSKGIPQRGAIQ